MRGKSVVEFIQIMLPIIKIVNNTARAHKYESQRQTCNQRNLEN